MKIWFGLVEAFKSYRGNQKKKKKKKSHTEFNLISLRNFLSVRIKITDAAQNNVLWKILSVRIMKQVKPLGFDPSEGAFNNRKQLEFWKSALFSG